MRRLMQRGWWTLVVLCTLSTRGFAQARHEVVRGRVTSDSGAAVRGADVVVTKISSGAAKAVVSDGAGAFTSDWPDGDGTYVVTASAAGYQTRSMRVVRTGTDSIIVANVQLVAGGQRLAPVVTRAARPVPDRDPAAFNAGATQSTVYAQNAARRLAPDQAGDLNAIAAMQPGVASVTGGGISVLGLPPGQNSVTLGGLAFSGTDIPRDAATRVMVVTSTYDPANGWYSGAQTAVDLVLGGQFTNRTTHWTVDAPALQYTDPISARAGQQFTNFNASLGGNGPLADGRWAYNYGVQGGRKASDVSSLSNADPDLLEHAGVAPDSAARLLSLLGQASVPISGGVAAGATIDENVSFLGRIDHAPFDWSTLTYNRTTYGLQAYGKWARTDAAGLGALSTPAHSTTSTQALGSLTAFYSTLFSQNYLADVKSAVTLVHNAIQPSAALPSGQVLVVSDFPQDASTNTAGGVSTLLFGGSATQSSVDSWRWETNAQLQLYPPGAATHRVKLVADSRIDEFSQDVLANRLGTFTYASLADFADGQPSTFTRTLQAPARTGGEWNGFVALGDLWRATENLQLIYGARVDANAFTSSPAYNPLVASAFGLKTDDAPGSIDVSPRLGFTYQMGKGRIVRGGVGEFRNIVDPTLLATPSVSTGLPNGLVQLSCVGAATPTPNWAAYAQNQSSIPTQCAGGAPAFVDAAPDVQLIDAHFRPQRSWRANVGTQSSAWNNVYSVEAVGSLNLDQPGTVDDNFGIAPKFMTVDEQRPVYVDPSSIVASTGAISPTLARVDSQFARVVRVVSDLRSVSEAGIFTLRPYVPDKLRAYFGDVTLAYTLSSIRSQARGFDGATFGDPRGMEWARGDLDARHQLTAQWVFRPFADGRAIMYFFGHVQSGLPFTPLVAGDVNGDGLANDRAFVFNPATTSDPVVASGMRSLLATASPNVRDCLTSQLDRAAARNSCEGPWTEQLNASVRLSGQQLFNAPRIDVTINLANPLAGLDQLLHGSANLHGWGAPALPDATLYTVRGFDASDRRFLYDVNPRFGSTSPAATTLRAPFRLTLDVSVDIARSLPDQMLDSWLRAGRAGRPGTRVAESDLFRRFSRTVPDPYADLLQQTDSLLISDAQATSLREVDRAYRARVDSMWTDLATYLATLPDHYDFDAASKRTDDVTDEVWEITRLDIQGRLKEILSPAQQALLGGWAGQLFRARDRVHVRLAPRAG